MPNPGLYCSSVNNYGLYFFSSFLTSNNCKVMWNHMVQNFDLIFFGYVCLILSSISLKRLQQWGRCFECIEWMLKCFTGYSYGANQGLDLVMCQIIQSHIFVKTHPSPPFQIQVPTVSFIPSKLITGFSQLVHCWVLVHSFWLPDGDE